MNKTPHYVTLLVPLFVYFKLLSSKCSTTAAEGTGDLCFEVHVRFYIFSALFTALFRNSEEQFYRVPSKGKMSRLDLDSCIFIMPSAFDSRRRYMARSVKENKI